MKVLIHNSGGYYYKQQLIEKLFRVISRIFPKYSKCEISIALVSNNAIRKLNRTYRKIDKPTDVLSFSELDARAKLYGKDSSYLGEIIIAYNYAKAQAKGNGHNINKEIIILIIHGFLHIIGYDHIKLKEEKLMKKLENKIINKLYF